MTEQNGPPPQPITQPAMSAVVVPGSPTDARVAAVEAKLITVAEDVSALKVDVSALKVAREANDKKVTTLETDMSTLKSDMGTVKADAAFTRTETVKQTLSLERIEKAVVPVAKTVHAAIDTPLARKLIGAIAVAILATIALWLTSKGIHVEFNK